MRRLWIKIRLPLAVAGLLIVTFALARLFSGPEDTWIRNEQGEWIQHGVPSGPPPAEDYQEPVTRLIIPLAFFVAFAVPLIFLKSFKLRNSLQYETATRDVKFLGYISAALLLFGILTGVGLVIEIGIAEQGALNLQGILFIIFLGYFAGICVLLGVLFFMLKRNCIDHYQLEKSRRELLEELENLKSR